MWADIGKAVQEGQSKGMLKHHDLKRLTRANQLQKLAIDLPNPSTES
jgi:hypothetical protein